MRTIYRGLKAYIRWCGKAMYEHPGAFAIYTIGSVVVWVGGLIAVDVLSHKLDDELTKGHQRLASHPTSARQVYLDQLWEGAKPHNN